MTMVTDTSPENEPRPPAWRNPAMLEIRRVMSRVGYRVFRLLGEVVAILLGLGIALTFFAASALERQSTDISVLRPNLQLWFAEAFNGKRAEFGRLDIRWLPAREAFVLTAEDVGVYDAQGVSLESFDLLQATLTGRPEDLRRPRLISAEVRGGVLSYVENAEGGITIGLGPPDTVGRIGPVYRNDGRTALDRKLDLDGIESIQIYDASLYLRNEVSGTDMLAQIDRLATTFSGEGGIVYTASGQIEQTDRPARFSIGGLADIDLSDIRAKFNLSDARADILAPTKGRFRDLRGLAAPVDLTGYVDFSREDGLRSAAIAFEVGAGHLTLTRGETPATYALRSFAFDATLEPGNDRMVVDRIDLSAPLLSFAGSGFLSQLGHLSDGDINSSPEFDIRLEDVTVQSTPTFPDDLRFDAVDLKGEADADSRVLTLRNSRLALSDARLDFDGRLGLTVQNRIETLDLKAKLTGRLTPDELIAHWPVNAVGGARRWIDRSIIGGQIVDLDATLALGPDFFERPELTEERVDLAFTIANGDVRYMETMPPLLGVAARGRILGNRFTLDFTGGHIESISLAGGRIDIPRLLPKGGDIIIQGMARGEAAEMLSILDNPPFAFASRYGVDPETLSGQGQAELRITRPLLEFFPREDITYDIQGEFTGIRAPFSFGRFDIENGDVALDVNNARMILSGPIDIGPWRPTLRWQETFGEAPPPTQYSLSGQIDSDVLDGLGIGSRGWFDGAAAVVIDATGRGMDVQEAVIDIDLTNSALSVERVWMKPEGEAGRLSGRVQRDVVKGYNFKDVQLTGDGVALSGNASVANDFRLDTLELNEVRIAGLIDGRLSATTADRVLSVALAGKSLDVSPWTEEAFQTRESGLDVPFDLTAELDRLILNPDYALSDASFAFSHTGEVVKTALLSGRTGDGLLSLDLETLANGDRQASVSVPDASQALSAFLGLNNTSGGELRLNVDLPPAGEDGAFIGEAQMRDFRLIEAPAMAQLLSLASLTGLADTLSGGGMQFERFTVPFTISGDDIAIRDARLYGPALGMTGDGDIDLGLRVLDFDGTIVPSYTANSILGDIPILGDIFVREKDGGLFALTYTVSGPFEKTQIAVNPLSALTPGFLRRIFKPDREKVPDSVRAKIEDVAPKMSEEQ